MQNQLRYDSINLQDQMQFHSPYILFSMDLGLNSDYMMQKKKQSETGCPVFASVFSLSATWKEIATLKFVSEVFLLCYNLGRYFSIPSRMIIFDGAIFCEI